MNIAEALEVLKANGVVGAEAITERLRGDGWQLAHHQDYHAPGGDEHICSWLFIRAAGEGVPYGHYVQGVHETDEMALACCVLGAIEWDKDHIKALGEMLFPSTGGPEAS